MDEINLLEKIQNECRGRDVCKGCAYYDMIDSSILQTTPECCKLNSLERNTSDVELVVKIPKYIYNTIIARDGYISDCDNEKVGNVIKNGTLLPKGHSDLVDRDDLLADSYHIDDWSGNEVNIVDVMTVKMAEAIIKENKDE